MSNGVVAVNSGDRGERALNGILEGQCDRLGITGADEREKILRASRSDIYGTHVTHYLRELADGEIAKSFDRTTRAAAMRCFADSACSADEVYFRGRPHLKEDGKSRTDFLAAMATFQETAARGEIVLLDARYEMTAAEGEELARYANTNLGKYTEQVEQVLAAINYARFTPNTMKSGADILNQFGNTTELFKWNAAGDFAQMPHLTISNYGIASVVAGVFSADWGNNAQVILQDLGSGTGATLGAAYLAAAEVVKTRATPTSNRIRFFGTEPNPTFYAVLNGEFSRVLSGHTTRLGLDRSPNTFSVMLDNSTLVARATSNELRATAAGGSVTVILGNYVFHRIPTVQKEKAIAALAALPGDVIVVVGDLVRNASVVNRRYFNFRDNGLLNPGNIDLPEIFMANGFQLTSVEKSCRPDTMPEELAEKLRTGILGDGTFLIASKGEGSARLLRSWIRR